MDVDNFLHGVSHADPINTASLLGDDDSSYKNNYRDESFVLDRSPRIIEKIFAAVTYLGVIALVAAVIWLLFFSS